MELSLQKRDYEYLTYGEMIDKCQDFFNNLVEVSKKDYYVVDSCNEDMSKYLLQYGTSEDDLSYYGKPMWSFRMSDHWNWYANVKKCKNKKYIQCNSIDMLPPEKRLAKDKASKPVEGFQVCIYGTDEVYHCVYGECYDRNENRWYWIESNPRDVYEEVMKLSKKIK